MTVFFDLFLSASSLVMALLWFNLNTKYEALLKEHAELLAKKGADNA